MKDLKSRFEAFMDLMVSIESIDNIDMPSLTGSPKKADYFGMGRSIIFEQKAINEDQIEKVQEEMEKHADKDYYPVFYGRRDINLILDKFPNKEEVKKRLYYKITKLLEGYISSANKQIESTSKAFGISNYTGVLVILNDNVKVLSPEIVANRMFDRLKERRTNGDLRFPKISFVLHISETHLYKQKVPLVLLIKNDNSPPHNKAVEEFLHYLIHSWSEYNGGRAAFIEDPHEALANTKERPEKVKTRLTRSEERVNWYENNRYMESWSDDEVYKKCAEYIAAIGPFYIKGGPKMPPDMLAEASLAFSDFIVESNLRGLDMKEIKKRYGYLWDSIT